MPYRCSLMVCQVHLPVPNPKMQSFDLREPRIWFRMPPPSIQVMPCRQHGWGGLQEPFEGQARRADAHRILAQLAELEINHPSRLLERVAINDRAHAR